jgi:hypothetical protein
MQWLKTRIIKLANHCSKKRKLSTRAGGESLIMRSIV